MSSANGPTHTRARTLKEDVPGRGPHRRVPKLQLWGFFFFMFSMNDINHLETFFAKINDLNVL